MHRQRLGVPHRGVRQTSNKQCHIWFGNFKKVDYTLTQPHSRVASFRSKATNRDARHGPLKQPLTKIPKQRSAREFFVKYYHRCRTAFYQQLVLKLHRPFLLRSFLPAMVRRIVVDRVLLVEIHRVRVTGLLFVVCQGFINGADHAA